MSSSSSSSFSLSSPSKLYKVKRKPVPDSTVYDLSAYLEQCVQQESSGSLDSTPSFRKRNLFPETVHSPTIRMQQILDVADDTFLRTWFRKNYEKVEGYDFLTLELTCLLKQHVPGIKMTETYSPKILIEVLKMFIQDLLFKFEKFNIEIGEFSGSEFAVKIEDHKRRVVEMINDYERKLAQTTEELFQCKAHIMHLDSELTAALSRIEYLEKGEERPRDVDEVPASQEEFVKELKSRLAANEAYVSSLKDEMSRERQKNEMLQLELGNSKKEQALVEEDCMKEIANLSRKSELNSMIEQAMMSMLGISGTDSDPGSKARSPNIEECKTVVRSWLSLMKEAIGQNQQEVNQIMHEVNLKNEELAQMEFRLEQAKERLEDLEKQERMIREIIRGKEEDVISLETAAQEMTEYIQQLEQDCELLAQTIEQKQSEMQQMSDFINKLNVAEHYDDHAGIHPQQYMDYSASPRDIQAAQPSPHISTPQERHGLITIPGTATIPGPARKIAPGTTTVPKAGRTIIPGTSKISSLSGTEDSVKNRFDIGKGLAMRTQQSGTPKEYAQRTRLQSSISPIPGSGRMVESPVNLQHRAVYTPRDFITPFISKSRFGYTDPDAQVLNIPPGDDLVIGSAVKKSVLLTSPHREHPLLVNIDVEPKPLVQSESGEHFICDISLNVQDAGPSNPKAFAYYGTIPSTHSVDTRYDDFTPKSIFKKRHFGIRKLFGSDYESPEISWPSHHLPSHYLNVPQNGYFPWSRSPKLNRTFNKTFSPQLNRTYDRTTSMSEQRPLGELNKTYDISDQQLSRTYDHSSSEQSRNFDKKLPQLNKTFNLTDSTFKSASNELNRTYSKPEHQLNRTYEKSFSEQNKTFDKVSPQINRTYDPTVLTSSQNASDELKRAYDIPGHQISRTYDKSRQNLNRTYSK